MTKKFRWEDAVDRWQREKPAQPSDKGDFYRLERLNKIFGGVMLTDIDLDFIQDAQQRLQRDLKNSTVNRHMVIPRVILRTAARRWKWIPAAPPVPTLKEEEVAPKFLEPDQIGQLLKHMTPLYREMCLFALATGLRSANVSLLEWGWIDMKREQAMIPSGNYKSRRIHRYPLNEIAMEVLQRRQGLNGTYVFAYPDGRIIRHWGKKTFRDCAKAAGLDYVHPHVLRHTFGSGHAMSGTDLKTLMELGGWKSEKMALRYIHLNNDHLKKASKTIVSWIRPESKEGGISDQNQGLESGAGNEARTRDLDLGKVGPDR